jgi:hypothetical protein
VFAGRSPAAAEETENSSFDESARACAPAASRGEDDSGSVAFVRALARTANALDEYSKVADGVLRSYVGSTLPPIDGDGTTTVDSAAHIDFDAASRRRLVRRFDADARLGVDRDDRFDRERKGGVECDGAIAVDAACGVELARLRSIAKRMIGPPCGVSRW